MTFYTHRNKLFNNPLSLTHLFWLPIIPNHTDILTVFIAFCFLLLLLIRNKQNNSGLLNYG